jgi:hypothetical protein
MGRPSPEGDIPPFRRTWIFGLPTASLPAGRGSSMSTDPPHARRSTSKGGRRRNLHGERRLAFAAGLEERPIQCREQNARCVDPGTVSRMPSERVVRSVRSADLDLPSKVVAGTVCSCANLLLCLIRARYLAIDPIRRQVTPPPGWPSD